MAAVAGSRLGSAMVKMGTQDVRNSWVRSMGYVAQALMEEAWCAPKATPSQDRGVQWLLLGPPGVGKGTFASRLAKFLQVPHIAMGDLVRNETSKQNSPMGEYLTKIMSSGKLLPDDVIFDLLTKRLDKGFSRGESGFILDGFPRTLNQAKIMNKVANINLAVNLRLREDALVAKSLGRRMCSECGGNFNVATVDMVGCGRVPRLYMPALLPPTSCASNMTTRVDDSSEKVVHARMRVYQEVSRPVEEFYRSQGKLVDFDIGGGIPETWQRILSVLHLQDKKIVSQEGLKVRA